MFLSNIIGQNFSFLKKLFFCRKKLHVEITEILNVLVDNALKFYLHFKRKVIF